MPGWVPRIRLVVRDLSGDEVVESWVDTARVFNRLDQRVEEVLQTLKEWIGTCSQALWHGFLDDCYGAEAVAQWRNNISQDYTCWHQLAPEKITILNLAAESQVSAMCRGRGADEPLLGGHVTFFIQEFRNDDECEESCQHFPPEENRRPALQLEPVAKHGQTGSKLFVTQMHFVREPPNAETASAVRVDLIYGGYTYTECAKVDSLTIFGHVSKEDEALLQTLASGAEPMKCLVPQLRKRLKIPDMCESYEYPTGIVRLATKDLSMERLHLHDLAAAEAGKIPDDFRLKDVWYKAATAAAASGDVMSTESEPALDLTLVVHGPTPSRPNLYSDAEDW